MDLSDMLDVIHYFYEEDMNYSTLEQLQMTDTRRISIFEGLYGTPYLYSSKNSKDGSDSDFGNINQFNPAGGGSETKPYIPPTEFDPDSFNPFGQVLDAPIG
jgi:hypothetical protein